MKRLVAHDHRYSIICGDQIIDKVSPSGVQALADEFFLEQLGTGIRRHAGVTYSTPFPHYVAWVGHFSISVCRTEDLQVPANQLPKHIASITNRVVLPEVAG